MQEQVADLEPQEDASESSEDTSRDPQGQFINDKSVDTAPESLKAEAETEEVVEEPEIEVDSSPTEDEDLEEKTDSLPDGVQERIDKVTKSWRETERSLTALEQENETLRKQISERPASVEPFKTLEDFEFDNDKYQAYMASEIDARATAAAQRAVSEVRNESDAVRLQSEFSSREKVFAKTVKDYDEVVHDRALRITEPMARVIQANESGPEIAYYLGSNPDVARRISSLPAEAVGFELGVIQSNLAVEKAKLAKPKVTEAPPPVPKIKAGDAAPTKSPADMTDTEFRKWREKQIANR